MKRRDRPPGGRANRLRASAKLDVHFRPSTGAGQPLNDVDQGQEGDLAGTAAIGAEKRALTLVSPRPSLRSAQRLRYSSIILQMSRRWLVLADDLTGAADCAIALGRRGLAAVVIWGDIRSARSRQEPILAYDTASRGLSADAAAARHRDVLASQPGSGRLLFKKIDSTLRGQPAAEIAATLECLGSRSGPAFGVLAAAFPATGRTTRGGRILVNGRTLEETDLWRRDHSLSQCRSC